MALERHARVHVRTGSELCARHEETSANNIHRWSRSGVKETVDRPALQYRRQFIRNSRSECMPNVEVGISTIKVAISNLAGRVDIRGDCVCRRDIDRMRP